MKGGPDRRCKDDKKGNEYQTFYWDHLKIIIKYSK